MSCSGQETLVLHPLDFSCYQAVFFWNKKDVRLLFRINLVELLHLFSMDLWLKPYKIRMHMSFLCSMRGTGLSANVSFIVSYSTLQCFSNVT